MAIDDRSDEGLGALFAQRPTIRARDLDELRSAHLSIFGPLKFEVKRGSRLDARIGVKPLQDCALYHASYGAPLIAGEDATDFLAQGLIIEGAGRSRIGAVEEMIAVDKMPFPVTGGQDFSLEFGEGLQHMAFQMRPDAVLRKLAALTGRQPGSGLEVSLAGKWDDPAPRLFRRQIALLLEALAATPATPTLLLQELEQSLIVTFLFCHSHNYSHLLEQETKSLAPWQVRRVEAFIEANWDQPLTIEEMAASVEASARSIFHWFSKARGYSPMDFLRMTRLRHAQKRLTEGRPDTTVTEVAFACGFGNLGHFSRTYAARFGELPSATLARAKGEVPRQ